MTIHDPSAFVAPTSYRQLHPTMGQGVAERTYLRRIFTDIQNEKLGGYGILLNPKDSLFIDWYVAALNSNYEVDLSEDHPHATAKPETRWETWDEVAHRVALGNVLVLGKHRPNLFSETAIGEHRVMSDAIAKGALLMSGRHLQQGDIHQASRNLEVFSNCSTAASSFALFMLLLNGSGVGRDYSDEMMIVDWAKYMPTLIAVIDENHPDYQWGKHMSRRDAQHLYRNCKNVVWHTVADSREGWGQAVEEVEVTTFRNEVLNPENRVEVLIIDFTPVRGEGQPIMGMQGRPSSGPAPMMDAIGKIARIKGSGMKPWRATLYIDHYLAEPVLVGGARRSARMSTKWWQDADVLDFIGVKRPVEFDGLTRDEVTALIADRQANGMSKPMSFLWSSNNSVTVDKDFWARVKGPVTSDPLTIKAKQVYAAVMDYAYADGTGEPGFINVDRLTTIDTGLDSDFYCSGQYLCSDKFQPAPQTVRMLQALFGAFTRMPYHYIVNPCGEIALLILGGFCVIADVVPCHADSPEEAIEIARIAVRALIRVNMMPSIYWAEVERTNRIGVGLTGIHEAAWLFFKVGFNDVVKPDFHNFAAIAAAGLNPGKSASAAVRAAAFWDWVGQLGGAVRDEAVIYSKMLGVACPHTVTTVKPSGSVSKLYGLSEGWHLPAMRHYIRWVQYHKNSPMIEEYRAKGYPVRELVTYRDHFIVGFPTEPAICALGIGDELVTAAEASMEDQFEWLKMGEFFLLEGASAGEWIANGGSIDTLITARGGFSCGNQISYTMKYRQSETTFETFRDMIMAHQPGVRCLSVMPETDGASYEYLPEEVVSVSAYQEILRAIQREDTLSEDVGLEHLDCASGACPIVFKTAAKHTL